MELVCFHFRNLRDMDVQLVRNYPIFMDLSYFHWFRRSFVMASSGKKRPRVNSDVRWSSSSWHPCIFQGWCIFHFHQAMECSICYEKCCTNGDHRLASLACGHLFGQSCIEKWVKSKKVCPNCNQPVKRNDVRVIFTDTIAAIDNSRQEEFNQKYLQERQHRNHVRSVPAFHRPWRIFIFFCYGIFLDGTWSSEAEITKHRVATRVRHAEASHHGIARRKYKVTSSCCRYIATRWHNAVRGRCHGDMGLCTHGLHQLHWSPSVYFFTQRGHALCRHAYPRLQCDHQW